MNLISKIYAELIKKGLKSIDNVPSNLKESVQSILDKSQQTNTSAE